jgi:GH25 family lysozyme M1 (1,4-beta-N-acetylmuramidase)
MIYVNTYGMFGMLEVERVYSYPIWFAFYNDNIYYPYEIKMWQYTESAEVDGIKGGVDMNLWFQ